MSPPTLAIKSTHCGVGALREALKADQVEHCFHMPPFMLIAKMLYRRRKGEKQL